MSGEVMPRAALNSSTAFLQGGASWWWVSEQLGASFWDRCGLGGGGGDGEARAGQAGSAAL